MILMIYAIHDSAVNAYNKPMFLQTDGQAIRLFSDEVNRKDSVIYQHPDQFTLFRIGKFNDANAEFGEEVPHSLGNGTQYRQESRFTEFDVKQLIRDAVADITKAISEK